MHNAAVCTGSVASLWRYPIKSMQGEEVGETAIGERGILGDRSYALIDQATGHIASAKHPRKWGKLLLCRAAFVEEPLAGAPLPPVAITLPDGAVVHSSDGDVDQVLSRMLGREVHLLVTAPAQPLREADRSPPEDATQELILEEAMALAAPPGTFFDYAPVHVLTTATLAALSHQHPSGRFEVRRFRPNIVVEPVAVDPGFVENEWIGLHLAIGADVQLHLLDPCPRCVVTTLPQGELARDPGILRTIADNNAAASATLAPGVVFPAVAGVYGSVLQPGMLRLGDPVWLNVSRPS